MWLPGTTYSPTGLLYYLGLVVRHSSFGWERIGFHVREIYRVKYLEIDILVYFGLDCVISGTV